MTSSARPLISVIIPTRERADTLYFAIQTALDQTTDDYEVIVSDNHSQDNTRTVVDKFNDPRLKYFNTGQRLSMSDNWEFALKKAQGRYVIFIGDDDAIMPGGINLLEALIHEHPSEVYVWDASIYIWPIDDRKAVIEYLPPVKSIHEMNLQKMAAFVIANGGWQYYRLPGVYHAAVSVEILDMIRNKAGRVFHSTQPDVFTSMTVPVFASTCLHTGQAVTLHGCSAKSNGASIIASDGAAVQSKFIREYINYSLHSTLYPEVPVLSSLIGDTCLIAMDKFPEFYGNMKFNYEAMWAYMWQLRYISYSEIMRKRQDIGRYHSFHTPLFLFYMGLQIAVVLRRRILNILSKPGASRLEVPDNIRDFAELLSKFQAKAL